MNRVQVTHNWVATHRFPQLLSREQEAWKSLFWGSDGSLGTLNIRLPSPVTATQTHTHHPLRAPPPHCCLSPGGTTKGRPADSFSQFSSVAQLCPTLGDYLGRHI